MTVQLSAAAAGISTFAASLLGSKILPYLADVSQAEMPQWMTWMLGPLGALIGMIFAVWWLAGRLNRAEIKADARESARDADRVAVLTALIENTAVIREVKEVIGKCKNHRPSE